MPGRNRSSARYAILAAAVALLGCGTAKDPLTARERVAAAPSGAQSAEDEQLARAAADRRLASVAAARNGDPVAEASAAAARGDFRFVGYSMLVPGIYPAAYGVVCRPSVVSQGMRLVSAVFAASDVVGSREAMEAERVAAVNFASFGKRYNKALLEDSRYPYRDICRSTREEPRDKLHESAQPHEYGFRDLRPTDRPIDLGEAARGGTPASLARLIRSNPNRVDRPDVLAMTLLACAVAYRRGSEAKMLLRARANPAGAGRATEPTAPIQIARAMRWRAIIEEMLRQAPTLRRQELGDPPKWAQIEGDRLDKLLDAAAEPYLSKGASGIPTALALVIAVDASGNAQKCAPRPSTQVTGLDRALCRAALEHTRLTAARGRFGEPIEGSAAIPIRLPPPR